MTNAALAAFATLGAGGIGLLAFAWRAASASLRHEPGTYAWGLSD